MPVVMRPEISFSDSGFAESARENITEYIEEIEYPTSPIPAAAEISEPAAAVHPSARTARNMWILKYAKESTRASIAAPAKVPAVRQAK